MNDQHVSMGCRQAALSLHAMAPVDRAWVLASLPPEQSSVLRPLLEELQALGIPAGAPAATEETGSITNRALARPGARLHSLDEGSLCALFKMLQCEPPQLVATLLGAGPWPWHERALATLEPGKARQVSGMLTALTPQPAFQAAVLTTLEVRLSQAPVATAPSTKWQRCARVFFRSTSK